MDNLIIESSKTVPEVLFKTDGFLSMKGRAIPEDPQKLFFPMLEWVKRYKGSELEFDINLEYINTGASRVLFDLLKLLNDNKSLKVAKINWHYEEGDDDSFETGKMYQHQLTNLNFEFFAEAEAF